MQGLWKDKRKHFLKDKGSVLISGVSDNFYAVNNKDFSIKNHINNYTDTNKFSSKKLTYYPAEVYLTEFKFCVGLDKKFVEKNCDNCQYNYFFDTGECYQDKDTEGNFKYERKKTCYLDYYNYSEDKNHFKKSKLENSCYKCNKIKYRYETKKDLLYKIDGTYYLNKLDAIYFVNRENVNIKKYTILKQLDDEYFIKDRKRVKGSTIEVEGSYILLGKKVNSYDIDKLYKRKGWYTYSFKKDNNNGRIKTKKLLKSFTKGYEEKELEDFYHKNIDKFLNDYP